MLNLDSYLSADKIADINEYTNLRFDNKRAFKTPEALSLYEQNYMDKEDIKRLCETIYGFELFEPIISYVPDKIIQFFSGSGCVPVNYQPMSKKITVVYIPELEHKSMEYPYHETIYRPTTIYYYMSRYRELYGVHHSLRDIPAKLLFDFVVKEAIEKQAADITISNDANETIVYYNIRKKRVNSNYAFSREIMTDLIKLITIQSPLDRGSRKPKSLDIDLTDDYRGRVMINRVFQGYSITIRLLPNKAFDTDITELSMTKETEDWLLDNILDVDKGLRLIVGETMSGKNTTALALLKRLVATGNYKVMSVEIPVEQRLPGVEQIDCENVEDYIANIQSLIRANPDFVYITEIQDATGLSTLQVTNTGKCVLSTLHANGVADTISRLIDITGLSQDRIIQSLHSIVYQELIRDDENDFVYPRDRYVRFTNNLKYKLYGKSLGDVMKIIQDYEEGDIWTYSKHITP